MGAIVGLAEIRSIKKKKWYYVQILKNDKKLLPITFNAIVASSSPTSLTALQAYEPASDGVPLVKCIVPSIGKEYFSLDSTTGVPSWNSINF